MLYDTSSLIFLSTLSLRRATRLWTILYSCPGNFYPRSPCGERQRANRLAHAPPQISIHALLAESDITYQRQINQKSNFYPRSPCGERQTEVHNMKKAELFLSTLSLRRATFNTCCSKPIHAFLSTLSLRRATSLASVVFARA